MPPNGQVAIIGTACRLPGGINSVADLWSALEAACDLVSEAPVDRFDGARLVDPVRDRRGKIASSAGGYLDDVTRFDAEFFGLSPAEAGRIDPQQRIAMELAVEALDDAGLDPASLSGSRTAVVMGASSFDYVALQHNDLKSINAYTNVGGSLCNIAGRMSHALDLRGPCFTLDTACSSSLTALHQACTALLTGDAGLALAGGVNAILSPGWSVGFAQAQMTSPTGRCHAFSEEADGYVRAEGGGVVVLKLLADALADGDRIHAVIAGTAVNFDGRTPGMSQPRTDTQEALLRRLYPACGVEAGDVSYVEAHGTGTLVGDAVECSALGAVLGRDRPAEAPLPIGSVKTNVGHLEAAAGMAGLLKALLVLRHRKIPPSLHAEPLSTRIDFAGLGLAPVTAMRALPEGRRAAVGVNAFGFGGANAHAVLVEAPPVAARATPERSAVPVLVSARTPEAAAQAAREMSARLAGATDDEVYDIAYTACRRRPAHRYRVAASAADRETLARRLSEAADGPVVGAAVDSARERPDVVFVFSGNGSQWTGMGADLMRQDPVFSTAVRQLDDALSPHLGWSVADALADGTADPARSTVAVPTLFAVQVGLVAALEARGVTPSAVVGHSVGELAAAHVSGALDLPTACRLVALRARCVEPAAGTGSMAAVGVGPQRARELLAGYDGAVDLAAVNSPTDVTLSGDGEVLAALGARLSAGGTFFRLLDVDYPYHHRTLEPCAAWLREELAGMATAPGTVPMISTVTGEPVRGEDLDPEYWYRNLMRPVRFAQALAAGGHEIFLEVGPHPVLRPYIRLLGTTSLNTLARGTCGTTALDGAVAGIVAAGGGLDWSRPFPAPGRVVDLPPYPWQRERHWNGDLTTWTPPEVHPLLGARQATVEPSWVGSLDPVRVPWLGEHVICGATVLPGSAVVDLGLAAGRDAFDESVQVDDLDLLRFVGIGSPDDLALQLRVSLDRDDGRVHVASRADDGQPWHLNARCRVRRLHAEPPPDVDLTRWWSETATGLDGHAHYEQAADAGYGWGPTFQVLQGIQTRGDRLCARYRFTGSQEGYEVHPALLDGVLQSAVPFRQGFSDRTALPSFIGRTRLWEQPAEEGFALVHCRLRDDREIAVDVTVTDLDGRVSMELTGVRLRYLDGENQQTPDIIVTTLRPTAHQPHGIAPLSAATTSRPVEHDDSAHREFVDAATAVHAHFTVRALNLLVPDTDTWTVPQLLDAGLLKKYLPLLRVLTANAVARGALVPVPGTADAWRQVAAPNPQQEFTRALAEFGGWAEYWVLAGHCGQRLADVLRGDHDPTELLVGRQPATGAEALHDSEPLMGHHHRWMREALTDVIAAIPTDRPLRILEIGTSSAIATRLLPLLEPERTRYTFTTTSDVALRRFQARFGDDDRVDCRLLDLDRDPAEQGFTAGGFDVVIAGNTLHSATDLRRVARHVAWLLDDCGRLIATEPHNAALFAPMLGLHEEWWSSTDVDLRPESPYLPPEEWLKLLRHNGFANAHLAGSDSASVHSVFVATRDPRPQARPEHLSTTSARCWVVVAPPAAPQAAEIVSALTDTGTDARLVPTAASADEITRAAPPGAAVTLLLMPQAWSTTAGTAADQAVADLIALRTLVSAAGRLPQCTVVVLAPSTGLFDRIGGAGEAVAAGLWGAARCLSNEHPTLNVRRLAVDRAPARQVVSELLSSHDEDEVVLTRDGRFVPRVTTVGEALPAPRWTSLADAPVRLHVTTRAGAPRPGWQPASPLVPGPGEVVVRVHAAAWNYRDVLHVRGGLRVDAPADPATGGMFGSDCAGVVAAVGDGVTRWSPGDRVFAFALSAFASHARARQEFLGRVPDEMGFAEAATLPTVWRTVHHALVRRADLGAGQTLLVHGGAGGVGLAAIRYAQHVGAEVIATAGTEEKRELLRLLGVRHVLDSRSMSFADEVLDRTGHRGVDVVLNSLAGEGMDRSLRLVRPGGHFVELGKQDLQTDRHLPMGSFAHHVSFHLVDLDTLTKQTPGRAYAEFAEVAAAVHSGVYRPLPYRGYTADRVGEAYELVAHSRHVGKVVIRLDDESRVPLTEPVAPMRLDPAATYLVTGGTSGFGAATVGWLAARGARHLVAVSRSGNAAPEAAATTAAVRAHGADLRVEAVDVTDPTAMADLIRDIDASGHPLRGIVHAAMVLRDAPLLDQDATALAEVIEPKVTGAEVLDRLTRDRPLDFFWLYSSLSGVVGTINQTGYAAANLHLEALARARRAAGRAALAVAWGSIGDTGYLARRPAGYTTGLLRPVTARTSLQSLEKVRHSAHAVVGLGKPDWSAAAGLLPGISTARFGLAVNEAGADAESSARAARDTIRRADARHAVTLTSDAVARIVAHVMQTAPERLDRKRPVHQLGLDSLLAVHVQAELWRVLRCDLTSVRIMSSNGIDELAATIYPQLAAETTGSAG